MFEANQASQTHRWQVVRLVAARVLVHPVARNSECAADLFDGEERVRMEAVWSEFLVHETIR